MNCLTTCTSFRRLAAGTICALAALLLPVLAGLAAAQQFPELTGRVVDLAGIISPSAEGEIERASEAHEKATSDQFVVTTLVSLQGNEIRDYGYRLGRHWGIGQQDRNNGVLLIVALKERKVAIEVGYGLEGLLTDALSKRVIEEVILPEFRDGRMSDGIRKGALAILDIMKGSEFSPVIPQASSEAVLTLTGLVLFLLAVVGLFALYLLNVEYGNHVGFAAVPVYWSAEQHRLAVARRISSIGKGGGGGGGLSGGGFSGGGFSGGGFSGGGGSFGGGGASGGW